MPAGRVAGFLLQNPSHPTRPTLYTNPAIFEEIQARFGEIRRHSRRSRLISAIFGADLLGFCRFRRIFWRVRRCLQDPATLSIDRIDPNPKPTWPSDIGGWFRVPPPSTRCRQVGSGLGPKPTWPDPWTALAPIMDLSH